MATREKPGIPGELQDGDRSRHERSASTVTSVAAQDSRGRSVANYLLFIALGELYRVHDPARCSFAVQNHPKSG